MSLPEPTVKKVERRDYLRKKNTEIGLTSSEIAEYKKLTRYVNDYIKRVFPAFWPKVKGWRTKYNKVKYAEGSSLPETQKPTAVTAKPQDGRH